MANGNGTRGDRGADPELVRVDGVLGRESDEQWTARLEGARVDVLRLGQAEAQKCRLRKKTLGGADLAISLDRGTRLRDGDVLHWDERHRTAVVARVDLSDVLVIDLSALLGEAREAAMARCFEVGHALGNQHWPAVVRGTRIYVPLMVAEAVMNSVMNTHAFAGVTFEFVPGADVAGALTAREAGRLFGAAEGHRHAAPPGPGREEPE